MGELIKELRSKCPTTECCGCDGKGCQTVRDEAAAVLLEALAALEVIAAYPQHCHPGAPIQAAEKIAAKLRDKL